MKMPAVLGIVLAVAVCVLPRAGFGVELELIGRAKFVPSPAPGVRVNARAFYTSASGTTLKSLHDLQRRSDAADVAYNRFSEDNGRTWSSAVPVTTQRQTDRGVLRTYPRVSYVDPNTNVLVEFWLHGVLPSDDPLEGMKHWSLRYELSRDGGKSAFHEGPIVHVGDEFSSTHPFPEVMIGKNSIMIGDQSCMPITLRNGDLLLPVQITPLGPNGEYHNPGGGYTYHDAAVLIGRWNDRGLLDWTISDRIVGDPKRSTRGMIEPTIAEFDDGRILMVMRGSNHRKPELPAYKWQSVSDDHGRTWTKPQPWTDTDDNAFYSPSSCSQLVRHSNGQVYWIGNLVPENPRGNLPRHPLVIGRVDPKTLRLMHNTLCTIDTRGATDQPSTQVSNFFAREDRESKEILVHCSPFDRTQAIDATGKPHAVNWTADAWLYRIRVASR